MNKFNEGVKQSRKTGLVVIASIVAVCACLLSSAVIGTKANATPSIDDLQATLDTTSCQYYDALKAQAEAQARVNEAESNITLYSSQIEESREKLAVRAKSMYMNGSNSIIDVILDANSISDLVNVIEVLTIMSNNDNALIAQNRQLKRDIESEKDALDANLAEANNQAAIATEAYNSAQAALEDAKSQPTFTPGSGEGEGGGGGYIDPVTGNIIADRALSQQGKPYV